MSLELDTPPGTERSTAVRRILADLAAGAQPEECFRELVAHYHRPLFGFFRRRGFSPDECLDLTQETFLGIYTGVRSFRGEAEFDTWLFRIATNVWRKRRRFEGAEKRAATEVAIDAPEPEDGGMKELVAEAPLAADEMLTKERATLLREAIHQLPEQMRRCLTLRVQQDLKYREIAVLLQLSTETVKAHLFKARQRLHEMLGPYFASALDDGDEP